MAFYDAITKPEAVQDFYTNEQLIAIARELTDALRTNKTIDWTMKESARAGMHRIVKRLLKKYKYPPEGKGETDAGNVKLLILKRLHESEQRINVILEKLFLGLLWGFKSTHI